MNTIKFFILAIILAITGCSGSDPSEEGKNAFFSAMDKELSATPAASDESESDDGGEPPENDPSLTRWLKEVPDYAAREGCHQTNGDARRACYQGAATRAYLNMSSQLERVKSVGRTFDLPSKVAEANALIAQIRATEQTCGSNKKCLIEKVQSYVAQVDLLYYMAIEHLNNYDDLKAGNPADYDQICVRLKQKREFVYVRHHDGALAFSIPTKDGLNQYTQVGTSKQTGHALIVESTGQSETFRWTGAAIGFVHPDDLEPVTSGAKCETVKFVYDREPWN